MTQKKKLIWGIGVALGFFLAIESATRLVGVAKCGPVIPDPGNWEEMLGDRKRLWTMRPNYTIPSPVGPPTRINAVGLRDSLLPEGAGGPLKGSNEIRVLTVGDSSVYGWGVPSGQTYQELLEKLLSEHDPARSFEVINAGVPGYSSEQTLRLLEEVGWSYQPDVLVISSLFSDANFDHFQDREALALTNPNPKGLSKTLQGSRSYCAMYMAVQRSKAKRGQQPNRVLMPGTPRDARWVTDPQRFGVHSRVPLTHFEENIRIMVESARKRGVEVVLAPLAQEWDVGRWSMPQVEEPSLNDPLPWTPYRTSLSLLADELDLLHIPFDAVFRDSGKSAQSLFSDAIHPTPEGAELMASALFEGFVANPLWTGSQEESP